MGKVKTKLLAAGIAAAVLGVAAPQPARADGCSAIIGSAAGVYTATITAQLLAIEAVFELGYQQWSKSLALLASDIANTSQAQNNTRVAMTDKKNAGKIAASVAAQRGKLVKEFVPSQVACSEATRQRSLGNTYAHYSQVRNDLGSDFKSLDMNTPGGPTEKGSLQYSSYLWGLRCKKYMNTSEVNPPASLGCTGGTGAMQDLDMRVQDTLLEPLNISDPQRLDAAKATILLLTDVEGFDPVRGPALTGSTGQMQFVSLMRQKARMGLARDILSRMIAMRSTDPNPEYDGTTNSRYARYAELVTGQTVSGNTISGVLPDIALAGEQKNATKQALAARIVGQKMLLTEFLRMTEQMIAVESVRLSMELEASAIRAPASTIFSAK